MFADPVKNLKAFDLREDMIVADLGAGLGSYAIPLAGMVPKGKVYAVEIQKDFLATIKNRVAEAHLDNVECLLGDVEKIGGTKMRDGVLDAVIISNILFQVEDKDKFITETKRILKQKGRLLLIDWSQGPAPVLAGFNQIISKEKAREMFEKKGFVWSRDIDAGMYHYGMILIKEN